MNNLLFLISENPCEDVNILNIFLFLKQIMNILLKIIPVIAIIYLTYDMFKNVIAGTSSEQEKNMSLFIKRIIYLVIIFFIPNITKYIFNFVGENLNINNNSVFQCLNVTEEQITKQLKTNKEECISKGSTWNETNNYCVTEYEVNNDFINDSQKKTKRKNNIKDIDEKDRVKKITVLEKNITLFTNEKEQIKYKISPKTASIYSITWTSSNKRIVEVDELGNINGLKPGHATITAKLANGKKQKIKVTVKKHNILMLGNSKTWLSTSNRALNPSYEFLRIAKCGGHIDSYQLNIIATDGGSTTHASNGEATIKTRGNGTSELASIAKNIIAGKNYDIVILQQDMGTSETNSAAFLQAMKAVLNNLKNKNAKVYIRTSWARNDGAFDSNISRMNRNLTSVVNSLKKDTRYSTFTFYAVRDALVMKNAKDAGYDVFIGDNNHQNTTGAFLVGSCIYSKVFGENAADLSSSCVGNKKKNKLGEIAYDTCS